LQETVRIVIIAENVFRTSIVYNFSEPVCSNTIMFEQSKLEPDRTWQAVSGIQTINVDPNLAKLEQYNPEL
jgi:dimethylglycine dehydrogenase